MYRCCLCERERMHRLMCLHGKCSNKEVLHKQVLQVCTVSANLVFKYHRHTHYKNKTLKLQIKQKHWLSWKGSYESSAWFWMYAKILDRECKTDNTVCTHKKYKRVTFIAEWIKFITYKKTTAWKQHVRIQALAFVSNRIPKEEVNYHFF